MTPFDVFTALRVPVHSINIVRFTRLPITGCAVATVCFHKKRAATWLTKWFGPEYVHVHLTVTRQNDVSAWVPQGVLLNETDAVVPKDVHDRLNLEFEQSEKTCPMPSAKHMAHALSHVAQSGWGSIDASEFADLILADPHIGPALRAYAKEKA